MTENVSVEQISELRASQERVETMLRDVENSTIQHWRKLAGSAVDLMLHDRSCAVAQLTHSNANTRNVALSVLISHWKSEKDPEFAQRCEKMAFGDPDDTVRSVALRLLGECYQNTDDRRIGKLLAQLVCDERQPSDCRSGAYLALFRLRGLFADWPGRSSVPVTLFRFPEHVHWSFVNSFFDEGRIFQKADPLASVLSLGSPQSREVLAYYQKGVEALEKKDYGTAIGLFQAFACYQKGMEALEKKDYDTAMSLFTEAVTQRPEAAAAYLMRARACLALGKLDAAIADFTKSIALSPATAAYQERGAAYAQKGLHQLAEQDYRKANELRETGC